jgi:hypothetical protein
MMSPKLDAGNAGPYRQSAILRDRLKRPAAVVNELGAALVDLLTIHGNGKRCRNPKANLAGLHGQNGHVHVSADDDLFTTASG